MNEGDMFTLMEISLYLNFYNSLNEGDMFTLMETSLYLNFYNSFEHFGY